LQQFNPISSTGRVARMQAMAAWREK